MLGNCLFWNMHISFEYQNDSRRHVVGRVSHPKQVLGNKSDHKWFQNTPMKKKQSRTVTSPKLTLPRPHP